jgi:predicted metal-binding membrane protein
MTPLKRSCRRRCRVASDSGLTFGVFCFGSTIGLMAVLLAISPMSIAWMAGITAIALAEKALPASWPIEPFLAGTLVGLGIASYVAPACVPGLLPTR